MLEDALTQEPSARLRGLEARPEELAVDAEEVLEPLTEEELRALHAQVREVIETATHRRARLFFRRWSRRSASSAAPRSTPLLFAQGSTTIRVSAPDRIRTCDLRFPL